MSHLWALRLLTVHRYEAVPWTARVSRSIVPHAIVIRPFRDQAKNRVDAG